MYKDCALIVLYPFHHYAYDMDEVYTIKGYMMCLSKSVGVCVCVWLSLGKARLNEGNTHMLLVM